MRPELTSSLHFLHKCLLIPNLRVRDHYCANCAAYAVQRAVHTPAPDATPRGLRHGCQNTTGARTRLTLRVLMVSVQRSPTGFSLGCCDLEINNLEVFQVPFSVCCQTPICWHTDVRCLSHPAIMPRFAFIVAVTRVRAT